MKALLPLLFLLCSLAPAALTQPAWARDELVTSARTAGGETVPYVLTTKGGTPAYAVILMPGGSGVMNPRMQNGKLAFGFGGNFLIRSRELFADGRFVAASTDATSTPARILAIAQDLQRRYGGVAIYVIGTSRSTEATMLLAAPLDGQVAGFVHTSSMNGIAGFDPRKYKSRHLVVYHRMDACRVTKPSSSASSRASYGTETIEMEGGISTGDDCEAYSYHGYNGIEAVTVERIKAWIVAGK
ncbi:MAG: hypothetical protein EPO55_15035 [Reyranella sp.]|uniref:hypothetical protein n=1 Tax=Reyranella sp. TaxID=1929291 RepID=UPI0011FE5F3C|nr:hypothetical protein [Reyranella sp.]TAJ38671.1 MAG: hypothetical protein EPO55_15035 [Reyranella sp.]